MNKYFLILLLILVTGTTMAQKKSVLHVISTKNARNLKKDGVNVLIVYKGVFQQDNTTFSADSAYLYNETNILDAFSHVIISQGDTLNIFGDKLNYNGNTKVAIMTDNVRMVDKDATLTTNYLTYSTATKIGTYTGGGKLVNKDNTLTSKNGYYFPSSRDAYFRYDVVLNTPDALIKTDTLRYNSGSRIAYFYGPSNIYGKKDNDTLYTENGTYNTQTEQAFFGKHNVWKQKTKSLKGDSLFYDRLIGYGKAVKHVTFYDSEQKIIMKGDLGEHFKKEERTLVTQHPYVVFVTEEKRDTSKKDTIANKTSIASSQNKNFTVPKNSMPVIDSVKARLTGLPKPAFTPPQNSMPIINSVKDKLATQKQVPQVSVLAVDSAMARARTFNPKNNIPAVKDAKPLIDQFGKTQNSLDKNTAPIKKDTSRIKRDSIFMTADTIETQIITYKQLKTIKEQRRLAGLRDTSIKIKPGIVYTKPVKHLDIAPLHFIADTDIFHRDYFIKRAVKPQVAKTDTVNKNSKTGLAKNGTKPPLPPNGSLKPPPLKLPSIKKAAPIDSVNLSQTVELSDTARIRILTAAHHAKIFKSDLQAKADSISFSYSDSVARMYVHPMIWVQGSQLSGDTINLQMKNKQLDNLEMYPSGFIVNIEKQDTTHFNQIGGKKMRGFFKNSKIDKMFVFGNAETIYFDRDSGKVTRMLRTLSSKIRTNFKNNEALDVTWFVKPDSKIIPINKVKDEDKILRGFIWKPKDRPVSKEDIIPSDKVVTVKKTTVKTDTAKPNGNKAKTNISAPALPKLATDTLSSKINMAPTKVKADSNKTTIKSKTDTAKTKLKTDTAKIK